MASRTKQKEEARARRLAAERARAERARRERRLRLIGGVVLAAVAVVVAAIAISSGGGSSGNQSSSALTKTAASVNQLFSGIPQSGNVLGNPNARVTVNYYGDLECPICRDFTLNGGWPQMVSNDVRSGKVKVVYKAFETATPDRQTFQTQQVAALAAGKQNRFWNYVELFYNDQGQEGSGYVTENYLTTLAQHTTGLNVSQWQTARNDPSLVSQVESDGAQGQTSGVTGTPTLIFQGPKGTASPSTGVPSYSDLQKAIAQVS